MEGARTERETHLTTFDDLEKGWRKVGRSPVQVRIHQDPAPVAVPRKTRRNLVGDLLPLVIVGRNGSGSLPW
jgi:hypothetical protein